MAFFFLFDEVSKMRILEPKNAFWKGAKKYEVKKDVESKNVFYKSCRKFYISGCGVFSHGAPKNIPKKKNFTGFIYSPIEVI